MCNKQNRMEAKLDELVQYTSFLEDKIKNVATKAEEALTGNIKVSAEVEMLSKENAKLKKSRLIAENYSKRWNLKSFFIPESPNETVSEWISKF